MRRLRLLLPVILMLLVSCRSEPAPPIPTPVPRTPVPLSPRAITSENARQVKALQCAFKGVARQLAFSPDGKLLAIPAGDRLIVYDAHSLAELRLIDPQVREKSPPFIVSLAFSPDGAVLAAGFEDGYIRLFEPRQGTLLQAFGRHEGNVIALAFSADGRTVASAGWDSQLRIWQVTDGALLDTFVGPVPLKRRSARPECSMPAAFSPDGALLAWACNRNLGLYRVQDGERLRDLGMPEPVEALAFSPDGTMLSAGTQKRFRIWRLGERETTLVSEQSLNSSRALAFSPDGQIFTRGGSLWSVAEDPHLSVPPGGQGRKAIYAVGFSPDGALLATGSEDGIHCFWGVQP